MNTRNTYLTLILVLNAAALSGRAQETNRMYIPFIDESSQSNVVVTVQELFSEGIPCPLQYTNVIDNTNLFTSQERNLLEKVLVKYAHITTNSGPPGSVFVSLKNAIFTNIYYLNKANSVLRSTFRYTNADATETVTFVERGFNADFRPRDGDGYYLGFLDQIHSLGLRFVQNKNGIPNGLDIQFDVIQKGTESRSLPTEFSEDRLTSYSRLTNGAAIGKYLMWRSPNNNLILAAEFKEPFDMQKHRDLRPFEVDEKEKGSGAGK